MKESVFWNVTVPRAMSLYANLVFVILWVGFFIALIVNRDWLDTLWSWVQTLPGLPRITIWLVFLPVMVLLWIWQSSWSAFGQVLCFTGLAAWTLVAVSSLTKAFR